MYIFYRIYGPPRDNQTAGGVGGARVGLVRSELSQASRVHLDIPPHPDKSHSCDDLVHKISTEWLEKMFTFEKC